MHILVGGVVDLVSIFFLVFRRPHDRLVLWTIDRLYTGWMARLLILMLPTIALGVGLLNYRP